MESRFKTILRPLARWLRSLWAKPPYTLRHWSADGGRNALPLPVDGEIVFDMLWQSYPERYRQLFVEDKFVFKDGYPFPDAPARPLVEVSTAKKEKFLSVSCCPRTGMVFHQSSPTPEWLQNYYATEWDHGEGNELLTAEDLLSRRPNKVQHLLATRGVQVGHRVLDIGCGFGDQLWYFKQQGHSVTGIEPSVHRAAMAGRILDSIVINSPIEGVALDHTFAGQQKFDLIYLNQVLEHLDRPLEVIREIRKILSPGGKLLIGVPDLFGEAVSFFAFSITHTHSFSAAALRNLMRLAGFRATADLSFPGYLYLVFEESSGDAAQLEDPQLPAVVQYVYSHFDILVDQWKTPLISVESSYLGAVEIGLKLVSRPDANWRANMCEAISKRNDTGLLSLLKPVQIQTPHQVPAIWHK